MQEIILMITSLVALMGIALVSWISSAVILKTAIKDKDLYLGALGSILLFCVAIPLAGIVIALLF